MAEPFAKIPRSVARHHQSGQALRALISITSHSDTTGFAYPSLSLIAAETGIKRKNLPRLISELERACLIRRERRVSRSGAATNTGYVVLEGVLNPEDGGVSSNLSRGVLNPEDGGVLKFEPPYREEEQTNLNRPGGDQCARASRATVDEGQNRLFACGAVAPMPAVITAEEKARRKTIWQSNVMNYARDRKTPADFRNWCAAFINHHDKPSHWSVKEANRLSAEMKAQKRAAAAQPDACAV